MLSLQSTKTRATRSRTIKSIATTQVRHFWPFHQRNPSDYTSHLDPHYHRFHRQRNLNTRAKLLKTIRRLNKWDLRGDQASFFTPKHIRLASHYYGGRGNRAKWQKDVDQEDGKLEQQEEDTDGMQLSQREKMWKVHMERMRKRVEHDPYEAIFGRRFEPFWNPLIPKWLRDDVGAGSHPEIDKSMQKQTDKTKTGAQQGQSYAYKSSTSWDSRSNKTRKSEWNSVSGETKHYEYDPISNRMIELSQHYGTAETPTIVPSQSSQQSAKVESTDSNESNTLRKAIPIPRASEFTEPAAATKAVDEVKDLSAASIRSTMGKPRSQDSQQIAALLQEAQPKKSASSRWDHAEQYYMLEEELDELKIKKENLVHQEKRTFHWGDLVRKHEQIDARIRVVEAKLDALNNEQIQMATEGQKKPSVIMETALQHGALPNQKAQDLPLRPAVERMQRKPALSTIELDDSAAHESTEVNSSPVPVSWNQQAELLQSDRVQRTSSKVSIVDETSDSAARERATRLSKANEMLQAEVDRQKLVMSLHEERSTDDFQRVQRALMNAQKLLSSKDNSNLAQRVQELEDAQIKYKAKINSLKDELTIAYEQSSRHADEFRDQIRTAEVRGANLQAVEDKYKMKLAAMKENLDLAYKQSSKHADEFRDQIKKINVQLEQEKQTAQQSQASEAVHKMKLAEKERQFDAAWKLDRVFKRQSSVQAQGLREQITILNKQLDQEKQRNANMALKQSQAEKLRQMMPNEKVVPEPQDEVSSLEHALAIFDRQTAVSSIRAVQERKNAYDFKDDGLEAELQEKSTDSSPPSTIYQFKADNLEAELKEKPVTKAPPNVAYQFQKDDLEAELCGKTQAHSENKVRSYTFKHDGLEAELAQTTDTTPRTSLRRRLSNELSDVSKMISEVKHGIRNPIDGTTAPATGNYASPTGFVNFDPIFPKEEVKPEMEKTLDHDFENHEPRIKREEAVFTGTRRVRVRPDSRRGRDYRNNGDGQPKRRSRVPKVLTHMTIGGVLLLTGAYIQGGRLEHQEIKQQGSREAWTKMAREYEKYGERGIAQAMQEMQTVDKKWSSGLFWK